MLWFTLLLTLAANLEYVPSSQSHLGVTLMILGLAPFIIAFYYIYLVCFYEVPEQLNELKTEVLDKNLVPFSLTTKEDQVIELKVTKTIETSSKTIAKNILKYTK